jgi:hypothetical protein
MRPIQAILIAAVMTILIVYLRQFRSVLADRVILFAVGLLVIGMILFPDATTVVANRVGVGRGVDLVIYIALIGQSFLLLQRIAKERQIERRMTDFVRTVALQSAAPPKRGDNDGPVST